VVISKRDDRWAFGEYLALLEYKISRREDLDEQIEKLALGAALQARRRATELLPRHQRRSPP
jgi:hypothetical protein